MSTKFGILTEDIPHNNLVDSEIEYGRLKSKNSKVPKPTKFSEHKPIILNGNEIMNIKFDLEKDCFIEIKKEKL